MNENSQNENLKGFKINLRNGFLGNLAPRISIAKLNLINTEKKELFNSQLKELLLFLSKDKNIHFANIQHLKTLIAKFCSDSAHKLQVITDFDRTFSSYTCKDGSQSITSFQSVLSFKNEIFKMYDAHEEIKKGCYPVEFNQQMTHEEKIPYMMKWWQATTDLIINAGLSKKDIEEASNNASFELREGFKDLIASFLKKEIPILVASAGLGDIVSLKLKNESINVEKLKIVSNNLIYNENNFVIGFTQPLLHSLNKNAVFDMARDHFTQYSNRTNIIIFGDSIGDIDVIKDIPYDISCLKIGFINFDIQKCLNEYLKVFDIVVTDSYSIGPIFELIDFITINS